MNVKDLKKNLNRDGINFLASLAKPKLLENGDCQVSEFTPQWGKFVLRGETQDGRQFLLYDGYNQFGQRLDLVMTRMARTSEAISYILGQNPKQRGIIKDFIDDLVEKFDHESPNRDAVLAIGLNKERTQRACDISRNLLGFRLGYEWSPESEFTLHRMMQCFQSFGHDHFDNCTI